MGRTLPIKDCLQMQEIPNDANERSLDAMDWFNQAFPATVPMSFLLGAYQHLRRPRGG
jgi:hypothetical protein